MKFLKHITGSDHKSLKVAFLVNQVRKICVKWSGMRNWPLEHSNGQINASLNMTQADQQVSCCRCCLLLLIRYEFFFLDILHWRIYVLRFPQFNMSHRPKATTTTTSASKTVYKSIMFVFFRFVFSYRSFYNGSKFGNYLEHSTIESRWCYIHITYSKLVQWSSSIRMGIWLGTKNRPLFTSMYTDKRINTIGL